MKFSASVLVSVFLMACHGWSDELAEALDTETLTWTTGGDAAWFSQNTVTLDGEDAAQSGYITDNRQTWVETTVEGPGVLSFWWAVSSEYEYDWLRFFDNGRETVAALSGEVYGYQETVFIGPGEHVLRWAYSKDNSVDSGEDCAWVDLVEWTPGIPFICAEPQDVVVTEGESAVLRVVASGDEPLTYQWYRGFGGDMYVAVADATNKTCSIVPLTDDSVYRVQVLNAKGTAESRMVRVRLGFELYSLEDLQKIGSDVDGWTLDAAYKLMADIDASETAGWNDADTDASALEGFLPIGKGATSVYDPESGMEVWSEPEPFAGIFDGGGHVIRGLTVNRQESENMGLFGYVSPDGVVQNLGLVGGSITGDSRVGGLVGQNEGLISRCFATDSVTGGWAVGGVAGFSAGTVESCYATGRVEGYSCVGGVVGFNDEGGAVRMCYATARMSDGDGVAGGFAGPVIERSYWDVDLAEQDSGDGGEGKTSAEMRQQATYVGWDFEETWGIQEGEGAPYFRLFADGRTEHETSPAAVFPADASSVWRLRPVLTTEVALAGCDIVNARWQVSTSPLFAASNDWTDVRADDDALLSPFNSRVPITGALHYGSNYYWRVRVQTAYGMWSDWSAAAAFQVVRPVDRLAGGRDGLGVWIEGLASGLWMPDYLFDADGDFSLVIGSEAANYEARVSRALSALMKLAEDEELRGLLSDFGYLFDEPLMSMTGAFAGTNAPVSNEAVDRVAVRTLPVIEAALADLAVIPADWSGSFAVSPDDFPLDDTVQVDLGDVLYARAALGAARAAVQTAQAYDLAADYGKTNVYLPEPSAPLLDVAMDGDESEWTGVAPVLFGDRSLLEYAKIARSATQVFVLARLADGVSPQFFRCEFGPDENSLVWLGFDLPEEGLATDWNGAASLFYANRVIEMTCDLPKELQGEALHFYEAGISFPAPLPDAAPTLSVTVDGDAAEWAAVPDALVGSNESRIGCTKIARSSTHVHVLVSLKDGWTFDGATNFFVGVSNMSGQGFGLDLQSAGMTCMAQGGVLEISSPIPEPYPGDPLFLNGVEFSLPVSEGVLAYEGVWFTWEEEDDGACEERLQPLNQFLLDHPSAFGAVRNPGSLTAAKETYRRALDWALAADAAITGRTGEVMHFIEYDPEGTNEQAEVRQRLGEARASLDSPQHVSLDTFDEDVFLGAFFAAPYLTRAAVPRLTDGDEVVLGAFPDPTFAGILPDMTQDTWRDELLGVVPVVRENAFTMDGQTFTTGGYALWQIMPDVGGQTNVAVSGVMTNDLQSWLETSFVGPGTLTFSWATSSKEKWNILSVYVDGVRQTNSLSGEIDWGPRQLTLPAGTHTVRWAYVKNHEQPVGMDGGGLAELAWTPVAAATSTTPLPVPYAWLDGYAGLVQAGDYEASALDDQDHDGLATWQEYAAGTVPTNAASVFLATIAPAGAELRVGWTPDLGPARVYTVEGKADLTGSEWALTNGASRFFRVKVQLP